MKIKNKTYTLLGSGKKVRPVPHIPISSVQTTLDGCLGPLKITEHYVTVETKTGERHRVNLGDLAEFSF